MNFSQHDNFYSEESLDNHSLEKKLSFSKGTFIGFFIFFLLLAIVTYIELNNLDISDRKLTMFLGIGTICVLWGVVIDQLRIREFEFWAVGSIISTIGIFLVFSPILLYGFFIDSLVIWIGCSIIGIILLIFGYSVEAYDLNKKLVVALVGLWEAIQQYQWKSVPRRLLNLVITFFSTLFLYIRRGFKAFRYHLGVGLSWTRRQTINALETIYHVILATPAFVWRHSYWGFLVVILWILMDTTDLTTLTLIDITLLSFLLVIGIAYTYRDYIREKVTDIPEYTFEAIQYTQRVIHQSKIRFGLYTCPECHKKIDPVTMKCSECGLDTPTCIICQLPIQENQDITTCPHCEHQAHSHHWKQWINMGKHCPICKK